MMDAEGAPHLEILDLGLVPYQEAHARQIAQVEARRLDQSRDALWLLEHPAVITLGRGSHPENLRDTFGFEVLSVERGGDVTLHAPGQIVGYWIRKLAPGSRDLHDHLRRLEDLVLRAIARHGVIGGRQPGKTGVWVQDRKIASVGVACRHWVTFHGFALNVDLPLDLFEAIHPCGFPASVMTSLAREGARDATRSAVVQSLTAAAREGL